jgi:hypothetical protein
MKMRRFIAMITAAILVITMTACGSDDSDSASTRAPRETRDNQDGISSPTVTEDNVEEEPQNNDFEEQNRIEAERQLDLIEIATISREVLPFKDVGINTFGFNDDDDPMTVYTLLITTKEDLSTRTRMFEDSDWNDVCTFYDSDGEKIESRSIFLRLNHDNAYVQISRMFGEHSDIVYTMVHEQVGEVSRTIEISDDAIEFDDFIESGVVTNRDIVLIEGAPHYIGDNTVLSLTSGNRNDGEKTYEYGVSFIPLDSQLGRNVDISVFSFTKDDDIEIDIEVLSDTELRLPHEHSNELGFFEARFAINIVVDLVVLYEYNDDFSNVPAYMNVLLIEYDGDTSFTFKR